MMLTCLLLILCAGAADGLCVYEMCTCTNDVIDCSGRGLKDLPEIDSSLQPAQKILDISNNNISTISDKVLPSGLQGFISRGNPLLTHLISKDAFKSSRDTLQTLVITSSRLSVLPDAIYSLTSLTSFTWSDNPLTHLPDLSFLDKLTSLDLSNNKFSDDSLQKFPGSLEELDLSINSLTSIPPTVSELGNLTSLELHDNGVSSVDSFRFPGQLQNLELSNNKIVDVSSIQFDGYNLELQNLSLSNNPLKSIGNETFRNMPNLANLDLSSTSLTHLPLALTRLTSVRLLRCDDMTYMTCDCTQVPIVQWYQSLTSFVLQGQCGDSSDMRTTLDYLSQFCPNNILG